MGARLLFLNSDGRILDLIRKGDEQALVSLYKSNRHVIASYIGRNNGSYADAEDLLQEALIILWERVREGKFEHSAQLNTFIFATVKNMWMRRLARMERESPSELNLDSTGDGAATALDEMIEEEESGKLRDALERLGDPCRKLLVLYYWDDLSMDEIAETMGFANAATAKSKKYQCKKALAELLKEKV